VPALDGALESTIPWAMGAWQLERLCGASIIT
jgi:hypothetical protein